MHGIETRDQAVGNTECAGGASCGHDARARRIPPRSKTRVTGIRDEGTLGIGLCVNYKTPGLMAPDMRTSVDERADGAACSRGHCG